MQEWDTANMETDELINSFLEFEKKYNMFKVKINNICIWHYLRFMVYNDLLEMKNYWTSIQKNIQNNHWSIGGKSIYPVISCLLIKRMF